MSEVNLSKAEEDIGENMRETARQEDELTPQQINDMFYK